MQARALASALGQGRAGWVVRGSSLVRSASKLRLKSRGLRNGSPRRRCCVDKGLGVRTGLGVVGGDWDTECWLQAPRCCQKNMTAAKCFMTTERNDQQCFRRISLVIKMGLEETIGGGRTIIFRGLLCLSWKGVITTERVLITVISTWHSSPISQEWGTLIALAKAQVKAWVAEDASFCFLFSLVKAVDNRRERRENRLHISLHLVTPKWWFSFLYVYLLACPNACIILYHCNLVVYSFPSRFGKSLYYLRGVILILT